MLLLQIINMIFLKIGDGSHFMLQVYNFPADAARITLLLLLFFFFFN